MLSIPVFCFQKLSNVGKCCSPNLPLVNNNVVLSRTIWQCWMCNKAFMLVDPCLSFSLRHSNMVFDKNICFQNNAMHSSKKTQAHVKTSIHTGSQIHTLAIYTARCHTGCERVIRGFDHQRWKSFFAVSDLWHNVLQRRHQSPMKPRRHPWSMTPAAKSKATEYEQRVMMASNHIPGSPAQTSNTINTKTGNAS